MTDINFENSKIKTESKTRCGVVTIIGRPSAGKSTFLNAVCGNLVSIVSELPQTTRNAIRGIVTKETGQLLFFDTPGLHDSEKWFNEKLAEVSISSLKEADAILYIIDATRAFGTEEEKIFQLLQNQKASEKLVIAINKTEEKNTQIGITNLMIDKFFPMVKANNRIFKISAKQKLGLEAVIECLLSIMPKSPLLYPSEYYTDQEINFRISEIIREKAIKNTRQEIPHSIYVKIETVETKRNGKDLFVKAFICVEHESQKGILIGKNARVITKIKKESLQTLREIFSYHIILSLQVTVDKNWRKNKKRVEDILK